MVLIIPDGMKSCRGCTKIHNDNNSFGGFYFCNQCVALDVHAPYKNQDSGQSLCPVCKKTKDKYLSYCSQECREKGLKNDGFLVPE